MVKVIFSWRDHPDKTPAECEEHYRSVHMQLAREAFTGVDGFQALVYNRVRAHAVNDYNQPHRVEQPADYDAFLELYFRDEESMKAAFGRPGLGKLFDDHVNFMDVKSKANIHIYDVEETVFFGARST